MCNENDGKAGAKEMERERETISRVNSKTKNVEVYRDKKRQHTHTRL
jgi:hypothetical protein